MRYPSLRPAISPPFSLLNNRLPLKDARKRQGGQQRDRASVSPFFPVRFVFFPRVVERRRASRVSRDKKEEREREREGGKNS